MIKILQLNKLSVHDLGGVETIFRQFSEVISEHCELTNVSATFIESRSVKDARQYKNLMFKPLFKVGNLSFSFKLIFNLAKHYLSDYYNYRIIHLPFPIAMVICHSFFTKNTIVVFHAETKKFGLLGKLCTKADIFLCKRAKYVLVSSNIMKSNLMEYGVAQEKIRLIPFWLDEKQEALASLEYSENNPVEVVCVAIGRYSRYKGWDSYPQIIKQLPNVKFKLVISTDPPVDLVRQLSQFDNVELHIGKVSEEQKYLLLAKSDILLFLSTDEAEAFGIVQLEAMCSKVAIVNTNLKTGVPEVSVHNITGKTVEITANEINPDDVVKAISELAVSGLDKVKQNSRQRYHENYSFLTGTSRLLRFVEELEVE